MRLLLDFSAAHAEKSEVRQVLSLARAARKLSLTHILAPQI